MAMFLALARDAGTTLESATLYVGLMGIARTLIQKSTGIVLIILSISFLRDEQG